MQTSSYVPTDEIRSAFSAAMSAMYREEVPAYGTLLSLVADVNGDYLDKHPDLRDRLKQTDSLDRISEERHGAIRLGTPEELAMMHRVFAIMGMAPVGYYDLSVAGIPVHSTAFRPVDGAALKRNPFRVFTSLLRLDLIANGDLREEARRILAARDIFTPGARELVERAEAQGGLDQAEADRFIAEVLETFRWHDKANVSADLYRRFHDAHRLIADVVSFKGPHINHLTPRTLDIDKVQSLMPDHGIAPKAVIEGPPARECPILLRQTSFKALEEQVAFRTADGAWQTGSHTARFGEIEQRGVALTSKGRALYDSLLEKARSVVRPAADGSNAADYEQALQAAFREFPDNWEDIRRQRLGYFTYSLAAGGRLPEAVDASDIEALVSAGVVECDPIVYEDFLPVSAAGIFQSNLGDGASQEFNASPSQKLFESDLGCPVLNEFEHYAQIEKASIESCLDQLRQTATAATA